MPSGKGGPLFTLSPTYGFKICIQLLVTLEMKFRLCALFEEFHQIGYKREYPE